MEPNSIWYIVECRYKGTDDWNEIGYTFDTEVYAKRACAQRTKAQSEFDFRVVRKTLISEVLE